MIVSHLAVKGGCALTGDAQRTIAMGNSCEETGRILVHSHGGTARGHCSGGHGYVGPLWPRYESIWRRARTESCSTNFTSPGTWETRWIECDGATQGAESGGDDRLTGTENDWLQNPATMEDFQKRALGQLRRSELKTTQLGLERNRNGRSTTSTSSAPVSTSALVQPVVRSRQHPMKEVAAMLKR